VLRHQPFIAALLDLGPGIEAVRMKTARGVDERGTGHGSSSVNLRFRSLLPSAPGESRPSPSHWWS